MTERRQNNNDSNVSGNLSMNNVFVYICVIVTLAISSWSLKEQITAGNNFARMDERVKVIEQNTVRDEAQDTQLGKQWRYLGNLKDRVMVLELQNDIVPVNPDLRD